MQCYNVRKYLEKLAAGEIDGFLAGRLHDHLKACPGCREEYLEMKRELEMQQQSPGVEPVPRFSSAWRQRIRQEAFKNEANQRSFFSVFKANTLIPALGVLAVFLIFGMFSIYDRFAPKAVIEPLMKKYTPAISSSIGLPLTVKFTNNKTPKNITYHWTAEYGRFLCWDGKVAELGADAVTLENKVYWSIDFNDQRDCSSFGIRLEVKDLKTGKIIAQDGLRIRKDGEGFFYSLLSSNSILLGESRE